MIICGYHGIGKSTLAYMDSNANYIDLESNLFYYNGERDKNWHIVYCNIAHSISKQDNVVFISTHKEVRDYLKTTLWTKGICYPSLELKDFWIKKLEERYNQTKLDKDYRAWYSSVNNYTNNIRELENQDGFVKYAIKSEDYDLARILKDCWSEKWKKWKK